MISNSLLAVYDLSVCPASFDFLSFLSMAKIHQKEVGARVLTVLVLPGPDDGFRSGDSAGHNWPEWRYRHILGEVAFVCARDVNLVFAVNREMGSPLFDTHQYVFPEGYVLEDPVGYYDISAHTEMIRRVGETDDSIWLEATSEARALARDYFSQVAGDGKKVVLITLRSCPYQEDRNSDIDAWVEFALKLDRKVYFPIFIPDSDGALVPDDKLNAFEVCVAASYNFELRMGMYSEAYVNLVVNNGPVLACLKQRDTRYLHFKPAVAGNPSSGLHAYRRAKWYPGMNWPGASRLQRHVWADDKVETISFAFDELVGRIEGVSLTSDSILSKCRSALKRRDAGLALGYSAVAISFYGDELVSWLLRLEALVLGGEKEELVDTANHSVFERMVWERSKDVLYEIVLAARVLGRWESYRKWMRLLLGLDGSLRAELARCVGLKTEELLVDVLGEFPKGNASNVYVFGCGEAGVNAAESIRSRGGVLSGFLDNDQRKHGKSMIGVSVYSPADLGKLWPCKVIIASMYYREIEKQLLEMGVPSEFIEVFVG